MIVRNESHVIKETLDNLCSYFKFDYWVIVDTGSTDNTIQMITEYFNEKSIPGEMHETEWVDFGFNRSYALTQAYNKSDYLLIFDADDKICGDFKLPTVFNVDKYSLKMGPLFEYVRPLLINNRKRWKFEGVLHEYLTNIDDVAGEQLIDGKYYIVSGRNGARNKNPNKYRDDAVVLAKAYESEKTKNVSLANRYAFYCAQSYKDAGEQYTDDAIQWYELAMSVCYWNQEKYYSSLMLGNLYKRKKNMIMAYKHWLNTTNHDAERIEGVVYAMDHMMNNGLHSMVNLLYHKYKNYKRSPTNKLFIYKNYYNHHIEYYNSVSAFYVRDYASGYECIKKLITENIIEESKYKQSLNNLAYYKHVCAGDPDLDKFFDMIDTRIYDHSKRRTNVSEEYAAWNTAFDVHRKTLTAPKTYTTKNTPKPTVFFSITTCKRLDLFKQTMNSILNQWTDVDKIDYWYCVDDNSSESDRDEMRTTYPWFDYHMKTPDEKGHRSSMNLIWNKLQELNPTYWIHMEDDFLFHKKMDYITSGLYALNNLNKKNIKQILFNRNYAETIDGYSIVGHTHTNIPTVVLHKHDHSKYSYRNCHYWPHYSFRPSITLTSAILELGNYDSENQFFEMDYAEKWAIRGYMSAFFDRITNRHIGRLTSERNDSTVPNAYTLNDESQFVATNNVSYIRVVNLKRRPDRKNKMVESLKRQHITQYDFVVATDGRELQPTLEIYNMFKKNDFGFRRGFMGCALSHYNLWKELLRDTKTDYYLVLEDDIELTKGFKRRAEEIQNDMKEKDVIFLSYSMFASKRKEVEDIYVDRGQPTHITALNRELYIGGTFAYSINKNGAQKLIDYIEANGINHGIDYLLKMVAGLNCFECQPQLAITEWNEGGKQIDTDIQNRSDCMVFPQNLTALDEFVYMPMVDQAGNNLYHRNKSLNELAVITLNDPSCVAFNSFGYCKRELTTLTKSPYMTNQTHGIYIKKTAYEKHLYGYNKDCDVVNQTAFITMMKPQPDNINNVCFIHSCNMELNGLTILDEMIDYMSVFTTEHKIDRVFVINIGIPIDRNRYDKSWIHIINLSENLELSETRTINILHRFCEVNPNKNILYLHTKGVSYDKKIDNGSHKNIDDWRNMMLYFLIERGTQCHQLLEKYDTVGCNYLTNPDHHYSGNFWWAKSDFIRTLTPILDVGTRHAAEFWLLSGDRVKIYEAYRSNKNHYHESCSRSEYSGEKNQDSIQSEQIDIIRVKMICNWCSSKDLCEEWKNMCTTDYRWQNIEITWEDTNIDYYVIVNKPFANEHYVPEKSIVFQMEPWVSNPSFNWGVKTWGDWAIPDTTKFLAVRGRKNECHNNAFWQLELTCNQLENLKYTAKKETVASICSSKYFDEGHIHRIDFLKFLEAKGDVPLDIFNQNNTHGFSNYRGKLSPYVDKSQGILPYKYYFMVENNYEQNFITEKIWEPILCETLVFYYGCPNTADYIDSRAFVQLDMYDFEKSYQIVKQAIEEDWWSQRIEYIRAEKKKILNELAFFPTIQAIITSEQANQSK